MTYAKREGEAVRTHASNDHTSASAPCDAYSYPARVATNTRTALTSEVFVSFAGVRLGRGIGLFEAQGLDDYLGADERKALRERDEKDDWTVIAAAERVAQASRPWRAR